MDGWQPKNPDLAQSDGPRITNAGNMVFAQFPSATNDQDDKGRITRKIRTFWLSNKPQCHHGRTQPLHPPGTQQPVMHCAKIQQHLRATSGRCNGCARTIRCLPRWGLVTFHGACNIADHIKNALYVLQGHRRVKIMCCIDAVKEISLARKNLRISVR